MSIPRDHAAFYLSNGLTLNLTRQAMRDYGWSPSTRLFEAAASGACIVSDTWPGLESLFDPDAEVLLAETRADILHHLTSLSAERRAAVGKPRRGSEYCASTPMIHEPTSSNALLRAYWGRGFLMAERVLITGGAGFVGSHLADALAGAGHQVTLFDNLEPQVHSEGGSRPAYLDPEHRLVQGDIRDPEALTPLVLDADVVFHLAAMVGVGQSMYQVRRYTDVNAMGMATLLEVAGHEPRAAFASCSSLRRCRSTARAPTRARPAAAWRRVCGLPNSWIRRLGGALPALRRRLAADADR